MYLIFNPQFKDMFDTFLVIYSPFTGILRTHSMTISQKEFVSLYGQQHGEKTLPHDVSLFTCERLCKQDQRVVEKGQKS